MTDLQGALIVLGVLAVAAVALYNYWQERQFRRRSEKLLAGTQDDPLLAGDPQAASARARDAAPPSEPLPEPRREPSLADPVVDDVRIEPVFDASTGDAGSTIDERASVDMPAVAPAVPTAPTADLVSDRRAEPRSEPRSESSTGLEGPAGLWYPVVFRLPAASDAGALARIRAEVSGERRLSDWLDPDLLAADPGEPGEPATLDRILRIQAVDLRGPATAAELQAVLANAHRAAAVVGGLATAPDPATTAAHAAALHEFCSSVDVAIGLNVAATSGGFAGTKLRGLIEAAGYRVLPDQTWVLADDAGNTLCTLTDGNGAGLDPAALRSQAVRAISLLLDVPRTPGTLSQFERMATQARQFAHALSGSVVDDSGRVLDEPSIARIRTQLGSMLKAMRARGIEPGDAIARRIFG
jgi:FtsZ-interacting cell division protein ZipA